MNESIADYLQKQKVATLCYVNENDLPLCFSCFFAFNRAEAYIYYKTSASSRHTTLMSQRPFVAGTVLPDKLSSISVQGLQFRGTVLPSLPALIAVATKEYYRKFPLAMAISGEIWAIQLDSIKMTDSSKSFGKKITWEREMMIDV